MGYTLFFVSIAAFAALAPVSHAGSFTAKAYDLQSHRLLYTLISTDAQEGGNTKILAIFHLPDGKLAAMESAEVAGGEAGHLIKYTADQELPLERGTAEVRGNRIYFSYVGGGKTKTDDEKLGDTLLEPPLTVPFIQANWDAILKGDTVEARFGSVERCETVGFKFFKSDEQQRNGHDVVIVTMKPSSFIIAAIRSPMTFVFDKATRKVLEFKGQILPKRDGKDQDADLVYDTL